jgi:hypothetical protein
MLDNLNCWDGEGLVFEILDLMSELRSTNETNVFFNSWFM